LLNEAGWHAEKKWVEKSEKLNVRPALSGGLVPERLKKWKSQIRLLDTFKV